MAQPGRDLTQVEDVLSPSEPLPWRRSILIGMGCHRLLTSGQIIAAGAEER